MESLRELLVVVDDHRILLPRLIVRRIRQHHLQLVSAGIRVRHQLLLPPGMVGQECIRVRDRLRVTE